MFEVTVQADVTALFAPEHVAQAVQGDVPVLDHVEPAVQEGDGTPLLQGAPMTPLPLTSVYLSNELQTLLGFPQRLLDILVIKAG